ncbi:energy transducer TonB [Croceibacterium mercuriale]|nr:energy transducer TonB [Croceibacterium mercuriale]
MAVPATAAELVLTGAPGSSWVVDNGEESCQLSRTFGEGENQVRLVLTQWAPGKSFAVMLAGRPLARFHGTVELGFAGAGTALASRRADYERGTLSGGEDALIFSTVFLARPLGKDGGVIAVTPEGTPDLASPYGGAAPMLPPGAITMADRIELTKGRETLRLEPSQLDNALSVLDACSQSHLPEWGLDAAAHRTMTRAPQAPDFSRAARAIQQSYPSAAIARGEQANLHVRVLVDETGAAGDCTAVAATRTNITTTACRHLTRDIRFLPALDAAGNPMKSFHTVNILFRID